MKAKLLIDILSKFSDTNITLYDKNGDEIVIDRFDIGHDGEYNITDLYLYCEEE